MKKTRSKISRDTVHLGEGEGESPSPQDEPARKNMCHIFFLRMCNVPALAAGLLRCLARFDHPPHVSQHPYLPLPVHH